jgi:hypothetical protein
VKAGIHDPGAPGITVPRGKELSMERMFMARNAIGPMSQTGDVSEKR